MMQSHLKSPRDDRYRLHLCWLSLIGLILFVLPGSTGARGQDQQAAEQSDPAAVVRMTDGFKFDPPEVTIEAGQTVKWINEPSMVLHTVTADPEKAIDSDSVRLPEGAETFDSGEMQPGDEFTHTFTVAGRYRYFCIPHEQAGMIGEVEVQSAESKDKESGAAAADAPRRAEEAKTDEKKTDEKKKPSPTFVFGAHAPPRPPEYREATGFRKFVYWLGNFHPASTALPVGVILAGFLSEILLLVTGKPAFAIITRYCVWVGGIAAFGTALLGWCLAGFQFYDNAWMLNTHRVLGTVTGVWGVVLITTAEAACCKGTTRWQWTFRGVLLLGVVLILVTGFFGGAMIYGLDHYAWP